MHDLFGRIGDEPQCPMRAAHEILADASVEHLDERVEESVGVENNNIAAEKSELSARDYFEKLLESTTAARQSHHGIARVGHHAFSLSHVGSHNSFRQAIVVPAVVDHKLRYNTYSHTAAL